MLFIGQTMYLRCKWLGQCLFMRQQNQASQTKPVKSLSARNFYKTNRGREHSNKQHHTLPAEPSPPTQPKQHSYCKTQPKSTRNLPLRSKQISFLQPEQLYSQNMNLKGKLNQLTEQLMLERVKHSQNTRHLTKMKKEVELQFEDDKYLDLSRTQSKLIEGVKHQYHRMKHKYEQKCTDYSQLLKRYEVSGGEEYRFHCEALELDNKKLRDKFEMLLHAQDAILRQNQKLKARQQEQHISPMKHKEQKEQERRKMLDLLGYSARLICLEKKVETLQLRVKQQKLKIGFLREQISSRNKKIEYLNKLLISKDNEIHESTTNQRKVSRQVKELQHVVQQQQAQLKNMKEVQVQQLAMLRQKQKVKFQTEKAIFLKCLLEKDQLIQKLDHDLKYLNTVLSYIKTGEEPDQKFNPLSKKNSYKEPSDYLFNIENSLSSIDLLNRQRVKTLFESGFRTPTANKAQVNTEVLKKTIIKASDSEFDHSEEFCQSESGNEQEEGLVESRVVKRSYLKHHPEATRMKQVRKAQIQYFRQELMYRLIFYCIPIDTAKDYLNYTHPAEEQPKGSRKQRRWRNHYISLKQAQQRLQNYPFELSQDKALLLARYLVEDSTKDDLFYHEETEVERSIAKSILRAFIGEYLIPDETQAREELQQLFSNNGKNLNSALSSLAPSGLISSFKLMEISRGIQVEFSEQCKNFILSRLAVKSPGGLNALNYSLLFQQL